MEHAKLFFCLLFISAEVYAASYAPPLLPAPSTTPRPRQSLEANHEFEKTLHLNLTSSDPLIKVMRPIGEFGPTDVKTNIYVRDIRFTHLNPEDKTGQQLYDWTVDLTFRQRWNDARLKYDSEGNYPDYKFFPLNLPGKSIWTPDLFFPESVKGDFHYVLKPNVLLWVYPNGNILYSVRITVQLRCKQSVKSETLDCPMRIASYGYTSDQIDLKWDAEPAVELRNDLYIPGFDLQNVTTKAGEVSTRSGEFSTITANFHFKKRETQ